MAAAKTEPRNPFYILLIIVCLAFVLTALAFAVVPVLEQKATEAGQTPPASPLRDSLREDGWLWLIYQGIAILVLALLSMGLDRWRRWRNPPESLAPTPPSEATIESPFHDPG
jgi:hypothetical protein